MSPRKGSKQPNTTARLLAFGASIAMGLSALAGCQGMPQPGEARPIAGWTNVNRPSRFGAGRFQPEPKLLPITHFTSAQLQESSGAFEGAVAQYREAIALNHNFVAAYERLGVLLDRLARYPEAESVWNRAVAIAPNHPSIHNNRGFHYLLQKRYTRAAESFSEALMINPSYDRARVNLGIAITHQGDFDSGIDLFREVLPEADAQYNLGLVFRQMGVQRRAAKAFAQALEANPNLEAARIQLAQLKPIIETLDARVADEQMKMLAAATESILSQDLPAMSFSDPRTTDEPCDPVELQADYSTDPGEAWGFGDADASRDAALASPVEPTTPAYDSIDAEAWDEVTKHMKSTWPRWMPDRFDYESSLPAGVLARLQELYNSPAHQPVDTRQWARVKDHMRQTWPDRSPEPYATEQAVPERIMARVREEIALEVAVQTYDSELAAYQAKTDPDSPENSNMDWGELPDAGNSFGFPVPAEPELSQARSWVEFDTVDELLFAPVNYWNDTGMEPRRIARAESRAAERSSPVEPMSQPENDIVRLILAEPVSGPTDPAENAWWVVESQAMDDDHAELVSHPAPYTEDLSNTVDHQAMYDEPADRTSYGASPAEDSWQLLDRQAMYDEQPELAANPARHTEDAWSIVDHQAMYDETAAADSALAPVSLNRWLERFDGMSELVSDSLTGDWFEQARDAELDPADQYGPELPDQAPWLTDEQVPVFLNGAKWLREDALAEQSF